MFSLPIQAQEKADTTYLFRFMPGKDMFYVPWNGNDKELARLEECVEKHKTYIYGGRIPLLVDGYCNSAGSETENLKVAKVRSSRVKSELILRKGLKEEHFVTRNHAEEGDFVTVRIVVPQKNVLSENAEPKPHREELPDETVTATDEKNVPESVTGVPDETNNTAEIVPEAKAKSCNPDNYHFALRTNLLRWATLTPDLGLEWRINRHVGLMVNGVWTSWSWNNRDRRYALWEITPEVRWYLGKEKNWYVGALYKAGEFNYKLSETGKQGDLMGGGITGGYQLKLNKALSMDFTLGLGYIHADVEKYKVIESVRVRQGKETKHWFGPINAGVTLVWNIF